jgi:LIVCS family branched-chain amino acid:cation transporter
MSQANRSGTLVAGMALFSMFFGAGDLIWPLILGGNTGEQNFFAMLGLLMTGVTLPLLGLLSMMLFQGDHRSFFGIIGKTPAFLIIFLVQVILGPAGSIPRLFTLSYATLKPYLFEEMTLLSFSVLASLVVLAFTLRPQKMIDILGVVLTPLLLICLCAIVGIGLYNHPEHQVGNLTQSEAFSGGIKVGYNTLDLIASFMFAPLVLAHFTGKGIENTPEGRKIVFRNMLKACLFAAGLLSMMYIGLTYVASYYTPYLDPNHLPEERLAAISLYLLGPKGALISCFAVSMACLTTAIPLVSIFANYMREDLLGGRGGILVPLLATLAISIGLATAGFMGIAAMLSPILQILCPGLIVLSVFNIFHKLFETRVPKLPVFATFGISFLGHVVG